MLANLHNMNTDTQIEITPVIDNVTSLQDRLNELADKQLLNEVNGMIQYNEIIKKYSSIDWNSVPELRIPGCGMVAKSPWPPAIILAARDVMFESLKLKNREKYIA